MICACKKCGKQFEAEPETRPAEHRVACADSTRPDSVACVMRGELADLCFTSPPYDQQRTYECGIGDWPMLMKGVFANLPMADDGQVLVNLGLTHRDGEWLPYWEPWIAWMRQQGWRRFGWYVWDQGPGMPGDWGGRFAPSFEFVFHFNRVSKKPAKARECIHAGERHSGNGQRTVDGVVKPRHHGHAPVQETAILDSVIRVNRQGAAHHAEGHPAPFPPAFPAYIMQSWPGIVYEPFLGSGTTIVSGEQTGCEVRGIEISAAYCAIALERLSQMGLEPRRADV
jgi:DNA modification methylase